jgi:hypothetical protein
MQTGMGFGPMLVEHHSALLRDSGVGVVELSGQVHIDKNVPKASCSKKRMHWN